LACTFLGYDSASLMAIIRGGITCTCMVSPAAVSRNDPALLPKFKRGAEIKPM